MRYVKKLILFCGLAVISGDLLAQFAVTTSPLKFFGHKAIVPMAIQNHLNESVESARAVVFLLDEQGKVVGQGTRWVIGGSGDRQALAAGATNMFYFVIASDRPFTSTNLTAKVSVNRIVLEGGKLGDVKKDVIVK